MEKIEVTNDNGNLVERLILGKLEGEALEVCKQTKKYFVYLKRDTGIIYASKIADRRLSPEAKAKKEEEKLAKKAKSKAIKLARYDKKMAELKAKKAELER